MTLTDRDIAQAVAERAKVVQRTEALRTANVVRIDNAATLSEIRGLPRRKACRRVAEILRDPQGAQPSIRVDALLTSIRYVKAVSLPMLLEAVGCRGGGIRVGSGEGEYHKTLSAHQRRLLADILSDPQRMANVTYRPYRGRHVAHDDEDGEQ